MKWFERLVEWVKSWWKNEPSPTPVEPDEPGPIVPPVDPPPIVPGSLAHRASFLFDNAGKRTLNYLSDNLSDAWREGVLARCVANGDDCMYVNFANQGDGAGAPYNFYSGGKFGGSVDGPTLDRWQQRLIRMQSTAVKKIIAFCFTDDSPAIHGASVGIRKGYLDVLVRTFDPYIMAYVISIEADECMKQSDAIALAEYLHTLTRKQVGVHQLSGKWEWARNPAFDFLAFQYGWGKSPAQIESMTRDVVKKLGKPVVASEYSKDSDTSAARAQGQAAIRGGAVGTGTGR